SRCPHPAGDKALCCAGRLPFFNSSSLARPAHPSKGPAPGFPSRRSTCSKVGAWKSPSAHEWAGTLRNTPKNGPNCDRDHFHHKTPCWAKSLAGQTQRLDGEPPGSVPGTTSPCPKMGTGTATPAHLWARKRGSTPGSEPSGDRGIYHKLGPAGAP